MNTTSATATTKSAMALRATASTTASHFHDLDELLLGPADLEAMPFEFGGCDFASAFDDKQLEIDAPSQVHFQTQPRATKAATKSRSHKRKSNDSSFSSSSSASSSYATLSSPSFSSARITLPRMATIVQSPAPLVLDHENDDLSSLDPKAHDHHEDAATASTTTIGRWTKKEHELFLEGLRVYGKSWKKISSLVVTRTLVQIRTHAQKYLQKQTKAAIKAAAAAAASAGSGSSSGSSSGSAAASTSSKNRPRSDAQPTAWKHHHSQSLFHPIAFPDQQNQYQQQQQHQQHHHLHPHGPSLSSSSSSSLSSSTSSSSSSSSLALRKEVSAYQHNTSSSGMSKLDQLLHDESSSSHACAAVDNDDSYYASPTGSDDDLAQWLQHRHLPLTFAAAASPAHKRRRTELNGSARSNSHANVWAMINPMEAMAAVAVPTTTTMATATHPSFYTSTTPATATATSSHDLHCHTSNPSTFLGNADFLPPLSSYAASATGSAHCDTSDFSFGNSWM